MKKHWSWLLVTLLLAIMVSGCKNSNDADEAEYLKDIKIENYVTLGAYKGLEISIDSPEILEEDIDEAMMMFIDRFPMLEFVDGPAVSGDEINIDFVGTVDGVAFAGGTADNVIYTLGSYQYIADLDDGMIGMTVGEVKEVPVTFPETYHSADLAGQPAIFTVTMNSIERPMTDQSWTDEYVIWLTEGQFTTISDFRVYIRETMEMDMQAGYDNALATYIADAVLSDATFAELPSGMVRRVTEGLMANISFYAMMNGMDVATYMLMSGMIDYYDDPDAVLAEQAELSVMRYIAYQAIADIEGLGVTDEELNAAIAELASNAGMGIEEYKKEMEMDEEGYREYLMLSRVSDFLIENAIITIIER
ncbi:MAG: trigger factor [Lachnospiraceae bacterium]|jgi:trigger factor|nr:trigger factor [Lachnospiraceae bacterium]